MHATPYTHSNSTEIITCLSLERQAAGAAWRTAGARLHGLRFPAGGAGGPALDEAGAVPEKAAPKWAM